MEGVKVACGQITWGREYPRDKVLAEIAEAGYEGAPAGRYAAGMTAKEVADQFARVGLRPAPGYIGIEWWTPSLRAQQLEQAKQQAAFSRELGLTEIYVASNLNPERRAIAGQVTAATATPTGELAKFADLLNEIGRITQSEGVSICLHNHVGSPVETRDEIDRLFAQVDRSVVFQGADIGHLAWAGDDIVQFTKDYIGSIKTLHLKDISKSVMAAGRAAKWDYKGFSDHGIFAEFGEGVVDFPAMFAVLKQAGFKGWVVVETDVTQRPTALESAKASRKYLHGLGV
jgi:inosose dehydratase